MQPFGVMWVGVQGWEEEPEMRIPRVSILRVGKRNLKWGYQGWRVGKRNHTKGGFKGEDIDEEYQEKPRVGEIGILRVGIT